MIQNGMAVWILGQIKKSASPISTNLVPVSYMIIVDVQHTFCFADSTEGHTQYET